MKVFAVLAAILGGFVGCTAAQLENIDPSCTVKDQACPDANGVPQPILCGYICCASQNMGPGQCPEDSSCMNSEDCSTPLPPNDSWGAEARSIHRREKL